MRLSFILLTVLLVFAPCGMAKAQSAAKTAAPSASSADAAKKARMDAMAAGNPYAAKLTAMAQALYKDMGKDEARRLVLLRNGFGMIGTVGVVKDEIGDTVKLCGEANPALRNAMNSHLATWQNTVLPVMAAQDKRMQQAINKDNFTHPDQVQAFLDQLDKAAGFAAQQADKGVTRITTPEACNGLIESMDSNRGKLVDALNKIVWPGDPVTRSPVNRPVPVRPPSTPKPAR